MLKPLVGDGKELREEKIFEKEPWEEGTESQRIVQMMSYAKNRQAFQEEE